MPKYLIYFTLNILPTRPKSLPFVNDVTDM